MLPIQTSSSSVQSPVQSVNHFQKLAPDSEETISSFLPPSTLVLASGVSKSFHRMANDTFNKFNYTRTIYHYLEKAQICSSVLFGALIMRNPPAREFFKMMAGHKKWMETSCSQFSSDSETTESTELFINTVCVALSLKEWALKSHGSDQEKALVKRGMVAEAHADDIVRNILANLKCSRLQSIQLQGKMSKADAMMFNARGRKNLDNMGVLTAFNKKEITARRINELDDDEVFKLNSAFFSPFLQEVMKRFDQPK